MIEACSVVKKCDLSLTLWRRSDQRYCSLIRFPSAIRAVRGRRHWDGLPGIGEVIPDKRACLFADKDIAIAGTRHSPWSTEQVTSGVSTLFSPLSLSWLAGTYPMPDWTYGHVLFSHKMYGPYPVGIGISFFYIYGCALIDIHWYKKYVPIPTGCVRSPQPATNDELATDGIPKKI